jgi:hypothetical protein
MKPVTVRLLAVGVVGVSLGFGARGIGQSDPAERAKQTAAQNAILRLTERLQDKEVSELAKQIVQEHASEDISSVFTLKSRGGLGIGKLTEVAGTQDGIERLVQKLRARKTITEAEIEKYSADYLRVARVLQAMAELAPHRASERVRKDERRAKEWAEVSHEFKVRTAEFRQAVEEKDPKKLRLAARALNDTCCHCHGLVD